MQKKNLLLITYYFPPVKSIGSVRNYHIAQHFLPYFNSISILTTSNRNILPTEKFPTNQFHIYEAATYDYRTLSVWRSQAGAKNNKPSAEKKTHFSEELKSNIFVKSAIRLIDSFPFNLIFGEGGFKYIRNGFRKFEKEIKEKGITHIHSSYRPYADHYIAYLIKKKYPNIHWTADMRDLHVDLSVNNVFIKPFQHWCNKRILSKANVVTTVSEGLAEHLKRYNNNVFVLRNGIQLPENEVVKKKYDKFSIAYTGSLFRDKRDPSLLFEVLKELITSKALQEKDLDIIYAGKDSAKWNHFLKEAQLSNCSTIHGMVSRSAALAIQNNCHVNVLLTYTSKELKGNITGKFYEYLSSQNPILLMINGPRDMEFERIMEDLSAGIVTYNDDKEKLKKFILSTYQEWKLNGDVTSTLDLNNIEKYKWNHLIQTLANHISINTCTKSLA